jgi:putative CocE/NonD family hydrolase
MRRLFTRFSIVVALLAVINLGGWVWLRHELLGRGRPRMRVRAALPQRNVDGTDRFTLLFDTSVARHDQIDQPVDRSPFDIMPRPAGRWVWAAPDRLDYLLDRPLAAGRVFTIRPTAQLETQTGHSLVGQAEFRFQTRRLDLVTCRLRAADPSHATFELAFNQAVVPGELLRQLTVADARSTEKLNTVLDDPPVHVFVMGRNAWRAAGDWPLPGTQWTNYYLHSGGRANGSAGDGVLSRDRPGDEPPDRYVYDPADPTPGARFENGHIDGPRDVRESAARADVLVYTTPPLDQEVEVVGPITARLFAATSARDTDWMVRLVDVHPDGYAAFLCEGVMRARHRDPRRDGAFDADRLSVIEPETVYPYMIEFWRTTGNLFAKGHRIRVEISSSYFPYYLPNLNTGADNVGLETKPVVARQTIRHDRDHPSHVLLPVIPR